MGNLKHNSRNSSLDLIRILALYLVISVHFFLNNGFYNQTVVGEKMYIATVCRSMFMVCVPLFIVLSGYLMNQKTLNKRYYWGLVKTLTIYVLASVICIFFKIVYLNEKFTLAKALIGILNFSASNYAWYVEMYIGLYILIPFLNSLYNGLSSKKNKCILLNSIIFLVALPGIANIWYEIIPNWWVQIYPIMYYFIGCYLREYGINITLKNNIIFLVICIIIVGSMNYFISYGKNFVWGMHNDWGALPNVLLTILLFNLVLQIDIKKLSKKWLATISNLCFGAYLLSYLFDTIFYSYLNKMIPEMLCRLEWYIVIVPLIFICSLFLSAGINALYELLLRVSRYLKVLGK